VPVQRRLALLRREAARHAAAARSELSSARLRPTAVSATRRDAAAPSGFRPRAPLSMAQAGSAAPLLQAGSPMAAWRHRAARPSDARRAEQSEPLEPRARTALLLLPEVSALACAREAPRSGPPAEGYARVVRPWAAAPDAAQQREVAASDAAAEPRQEAVAVLAAAAVLQQAVAARDAEGVVQRLAGPDARAAARPSAAPWVFRRGLILPLPAPRRAARSAHAMRKLRAASRSEPTWQAARCEVLS
jgi:hypothetical protein